MWLHKLHGLVNVHVWRRAADSWCDTFIWCCTDGAWRHIDTFPHSQSLACGMYAIAHKSCKLKWFRSTRETLFWRFCGFFLLEKYSGKETGVDLFMFITDHPQVELLVHLWWTKQGSFGQGFKSYNLPETQNSLQSLYTPLRQNIKRMRDRKVISLCPSALLIHPLAS